MLITDNKTKLNYLNNNVRFILNTKILWERRQSERPIIQCHRCQRWGHATSNCQRQPRCLKCAASHLTNECLKTRETPATCANCQGDHPANFSKCPVYVSRLELLEEKREKITERFMPAQPPAFNAWERRRQQQQSGLTDPVTRPVNMRSGGPTSAAMPDVRESVGTFNSIADEVKKLNNLVNLKGLLEAFRDLNKLLEGALSPHEKFITFAQFTSNLDKYNI
nr:unnamed protein product [Callosobruchus analis]CAI5865709.1 unnamed protein product [Callosobruchus analis]